MAKKTYDLVGWTDESSGETPVNSDNLNHMDRAIKYLYDEGATSKDIFVCADGQTKEDAPEEAKVVFENTTVNTKASEVINSMDGNQTDLAPSVDAVKNYAKEVYSTDEVKTNKVWIDGKPIYRKTYSVSMNSGAGTDTTIPLNVPDIKLITKFNGIVDNTVQGFPIPNVIYGLANNIEVYIAYATGIHIIPQSDRAGYTAYCIIEYTKTTD